MDPNAKDEDGDTAPHDATRYGKAAEKLEALLEGRADRALRNNAGKLPWDYARENEALLGSSVLERLRPDGDGRLETGSARAMRPFGVWFAARPGAWRSYGVGAFAILLGAFLSVRSIVENDGAFALGVGGILYWAFMPDGPLVIVGIYAIRRPTELPRVLGAFVGALSAPLYIPLIGMSHPNDAGADIGRTMVGVIMPLAVPVNMLIGAALGERLGRPWWTRTDLKATLIEPRCRRFGRRESSAPALRRSVCRYCGRPIGRPRQTPKSLCGSSCILESFPPSRLLFSASARRCCHRDSPSCAAP